MKVGLLGVVGIVFLILKLVGVINWSWWLVLLPFYFPIVLVFFLAGIVVIMEALG